MRKHSVSRVSDGRPAFIEDRNALFAPRTFSVAPVVLEASGGYAIIGFETAPRRPALSAKGVPMRVGIAADHGGLALKGELAQRLRGAGFEVVDFGAHQLNPDDDYPDLIAPLAKAVAAGEVDRGIAVCGSGVGACVAANKVPGVRAALICDHFSAHQGVEDDDMNLICLGGRVVGPLLAWDLAQSFLSARFRTEPRYRRRLDKIAHLERGQ
jgi:ribose 5-phosphate isomerase B